MDDLIGGILDGLFDIITTALEAVLSTFVGRILYFIETGLCKIVGMLDQMFQVFAGITKVSYDGNKDYLVNIFFNNRSINNVYWGMALIGIAMAFGFAMAATVRKLFDASGRQQQSWGQMATGFVRTVILILGMSAIMVIVLNSTNVLMQQINYIFSDPENLDVSETKTYTDEEYAAMGRALNTIGNYALNPSYSSRYNINTCFNEIRQDLYYLQNQQVFRYYYTTEDAEGNAVNTWQGVLQKVANSHDLNTDLKLDVNYDAVTKALLEAMDIVCHDPSFRPLESYSRVMPAGGTLPLDRYLFLMGTMKAAKNSEYNKNPELTDPVRGPYYSGEKSIYNINQVTSDFDVGFATDYLVVFLAAIALIFDLVTIILNCIARIFNMLFLYLIAPPIFATQPFDGGGKTKQWLTAFVVQSFSVFGTVIAMRLLLVLLPIVTSAKLVLFQNAMLNAMAKLVLMYGLFEVAKKATGLLTGILADSAGMQSIQAGDMSGSAGKLIGGVTGAAMAMGSTALKATGKATGKVADFATRPAQNLARRGWNATGGRVVNAWNNLGKGNSGGEGKALPGSQGGSGGDGETLPGGQGGSGAPAGEASTYDTVKSQIQGAENAMRLAEKDPAKLEQLKEQAMSNPAYQQELSAAFAKAEKDTGGSGSAVSSALDADSKAVGVSSGALAGMSGSAPGNGAVGPAKSPPPLPGRRGGNGAKRPLSPQTQKLFGVDANGKVPQKAPQAGVKKPLSPQTQKLFGADGSGEVPQKAPQAGENRPLSPQAQKLFGVDASGKAKTPPPQKQQNVPPRQEGGLPHNQNGKT